VTDIAVTLILAAPLVAPVVTTDNTLNVSLITDAPASVLSLVTSGDILSAYSTSVAPIAAPGTAPVNAAISLIYERGIPGQTGPTGPAGPTGTPGAGGRSLDFTQAVPSTVWTINHNFGLYPSVTVVGPTGLVEGDVTYIDLNNLSITFAVPISGVAYLV
jgi:hypothetical protein